MADISKEEAEALRRHRREELVLPVVLRGDQGLRYAGGIIDLSAGGTKVRIEGEIPVGTELRVDISALRFVATGIVVRSDRVPDGSLVAVKFKEPQDMIPGRLLEYKLRLRSR